MEAKLKALKVVDLKQILASAKVSTTTKATKGDLIVKILASKDALDAYAKQYPQDDLLAPPEEVDWNAEQPEITVPTPQLSKSAAPKPLSKPAAPPPPASPAKQAPVTTTTTTSIDNHTPAEDTELEKRKKRAERFGIPVIEQQSKVVKQTPAKTPVSGVTADKLEARAKRFGVDDQPAQSNGRKRVAQAEEVDPEELERRKKRAERFGLPIKT